MEPLTEPVRDAQLEKAYQLEKEDANSGDEEDGSDSDGNEKDTTTDEPLSKKQKREEEVTFHL